MQYYVSKIDENNLKLTIKEKEISEIFFKIHIVCWKYVFAENDIFNKVSQQLYVSQKRNKLGRDGRFY